MRVYYATPSWPGRWPFPSATCDRGFNDADDIAAVAVAALTGSGHAGHTYELSGPARLSFHDATEIISRVSGHPVEYLGEPEDYLRVMTGFGVDREQVLGEIKAFASLRATGDAELTDTIERVTGRTPRSFEAYAADAAARGAWARAGG